MSFAYRLKNTGYNSARYGVCEVCKLHVSEVFHLCETRACIDPETGMMGYTHDGARSYIFGHRDCLVALTELHFTT